MHGEYLADISFLHSMFRNRFPVVFAVENFSYWKNEPSILQATLI